MARSLPAFAFAISALLLTGGGGRGGSSGFGLFGLFGGETSSSSPFSSGSLLFADAAGIKEPKGSKVSVLNKDLFPRFVAHQKLVLMEFYAPWCGHCQELAPKYREAAERLHAMKKAGEIPVKVAFAKMDDSDEFNQGGRFGSEEKYNFSSYPALFVFKDGDLKHPTPYHGGREVEDLVLWMRAVALGKDPIEEEIKSRPSLYRHKTSALPDLSPETFNATVKRPASEDGDNAVVVVEFYSDRCPFCQSLSPEVVAAAERLALEEPRARLAACNTRVYHGIAHENGVAGYPWVAAFYNGRKVEDMAGLGGADSIVAFAKRMVAAHYDPSLGPPPTPAAAAAYEYDGDGVLVLAKAAQKWAEEEKARHGNPDWLQAVRDEIRRERAEYETNDDDEEGARSKPQKAHEAAAAAEAASPQATVVAAAAVSTGGEVDEGVAVAALPEAAEAEAEGDKGAVWRATLGRQTWFFLHTMAAKYPEYPSEVDQRAMRNLVAGLGQHYPCKACRRHLRQKLMDPALGPVAVESRAALSQWFCRLHNMVNKDTGKAHVHDCSAFALDLQYLKDCGECEVGGKADKEPSEEGEEDEGGASSSHAVFDARVYAKDEAQHLSELAEAMEALAAKVAALDTENARLKAQIATATTNGAAAG